MRHLLQENFLPVPLDRKRLEQCCQINPDWLLAVENCFRERWMASQEVEGRIAASIDLIVAREFWKQHPKLNGQSRNTPKKIEEAVNDERKKQGLGREPLAVKSISDRLSAALKEASAKP